MKTLGIPCYLSGGTALSRGYFHHRYSDDLDIFMNRENRYSDYIQIMLERFETAQAAGEFSIDYARIRKYENFTQIFLAKTDEPKIIELKLDLVNDVAAHYGGFTQDSVLGSLDSWQNILSNKLTAVFRYEAKDVVDIWVIAKHKAFDWIAMMEEAKTKEGGIDPLIIFEILSSFPKDALETVKWKVSVDTETFMMELNQIADDILHGRKNSLCKNIAG
ncbi:MAG: nucleotidyl transferase AbiEii/AbiGii toxin family protein [bacterium]|nr:nucleotidyl transferase AbiEii/AbiGii toxin family protein [bacterium]